MPRNRLSRLLFAAWSVLLVGVVVVSQWLAAVEMARLVERREEARLVAAARSIAANLPAGGDSGAVVGETGRSAGAAVELLDAEGRVTSTPAAGPAVSAAPLDPTALGMVLAGETVTTTRYDAGSGRRTISVAVPAVRDGRTVNVVRVTGGSDDEGLVAAQRRLLGGAAAMLLVALVAGWLLARHAARPVADLADAAARLADGALDTPLPGAEAEEVAGLADAIGRLRRQLVERGLTIGRQGTQQEAVLGSMIEGVLAVDARERVVSLNRAAADLLGVDPDPDGWTGRGVQEVVRNPDLRKFAIEAILLGEPVEDDIVLRAARDRVLRVRGTPLREASGTGGAVVVLEDITDIRHLENVRRDFVANVSHELKTPVASIQGFVETLLEGRAEDPADRRRFLEIVARQAGRLGAIIDDLLALSRIEESEEAGDLPTEPVAVAGLLAAVVAECRPRAEARSIGLEVVCPAELVAKVNPPLLEQALINLVDNAIKYSDPGKPVHLSATGDGDGTEIVVRDEGAGIAAEHLPRLFERFYRVDKGRSRKLGGTGLGLAIVKHIVQAHGGTVAVESTPGVGSTFRVRLPVGGV